VTGKIDKLYLEPTIKEMVVLRFQKVIRFVNKKFVLIRWGKGN
jgi:hypothetical protein